MRQNGDKDDVAATDAGEEAGKEKVILSLSSDVLAAFRATGPGWEARIDLALRAWLVRQLTPEADAAGPATTSPPRPERTPAPGLVGLISDVAGPALKANLLPQMEQIAMETAGRVVQDVAIRIAREMAQAAGTAARQSLAQPRRPDPAPASVETAEGDEDGEGKASG